MTTPQQFEQQFAQFWAAYPRKAGKGNARKYFERALRKTTLEVMLAALAWQRNQPQWLENGGQWVPYPGSWLNAERWADEPFEPPRPVPAVKGAAIADEQLQKTQRLRELLAAGLDRAEALRQAGF